MTECSTDQTRMYTRCASLAALGVKVQEMDLFEPIRRRVQIAQKTVKDRPIEKVYDGWIAILARAHGLVEINTRLRADPVLQAAFGRSRCAEQSVVQQTLDACTPDTVQQIEEAMDEIYLLAYVAFYDQRGGAVETSFKGDKQGLGLTKRAKKRFAAQQMVMLLSQLAHNVIVWAQRWLDVPKLTRYGIKRMVRDVFHVSGFLVRDVSGSIRQIALNRAAPLAASLRDALAALLAPAHVAVILDKT